jgi:endonuclease I
MKFSFSKFLFVFVFLIVSFVNIYSQDSAYYAGINLTSPTLVADLEARVRSPFTPYSYTQFRDIYIPGYEAQPVIGSTTLKSVSCAYSGYVLTYTPPFSFNNSTANFSREHTYCQSWWDVPSTSAPYYSDWHFLFLTEQDHANGVRSNYPLGDVTGTVSSSFLLCKQGQGTTSSGIGTVFEPRQGDKGDAARGLLYMVLMYDQNGSDGNWNIKWLNQTKGIPQDYATLVNWSNQDPPDKWEIERNNYIVSYTKNRNPFVDHPEYLKYVSMYDMTKLSPIFAAEPTNQVGSFTSSVSGNSITVNWTNPGGAQTPSGYLIQAYNADNYFLPIDGESYPDSLAFTYGKGEVNITNDGTTSYTFNGLAFSTAYYFTIYSYNGDGALRNYKTLGFLRTNATTSAVAPVELVSFTASEQFNAVTLNWRTATEQNNNGFDIERGNIKNSGGDIIYSKIGFIKGSGNSNSYKEYTFTDKPAVSGKYYYRLIQNDNNGDFKMSDAVEVNFKPAVKGYYLDQNYPNPFNPSTIISYTVPSSSNVKITIFNTLGQSVRILENEHKEAGTYQITFDAGNLNSGTYFYKIEAGEFSQTKKMCLVK